MVRGTRVPKDIKRLEREPKKQLNKWSVLIPATILITCLIIFYFLVK